MENSRQLSHYMNGPICSIFEVRVSALRSLGIISRISLPFSRRGLDIWSMRLLPQDQQERVLVLLEFNGTGEQIESVLRDLRKIPHVLGLSCLNVSAIVNFNERMTL